MANNQETSDTKYKRESSVDSKYKRESALDEDGNNARNIKRESKDRIKNYEPLKDHDLKNKSGQLVNNSSGQLTKKTKSLLKSANIAPATREELAHLQQLVRDLVQGDAKYIIIIDY
jgi:hypothetical protein